LTLSTTTTRPAATSAGSPSTASSAVSVEYVSKTFRLPHRQYSTLKERALHPLRSTTYDELHAVQDISLEIAEGNSLGSSGATAAARALC
jgi:ABC-type polysaccharide/polyol phosphate transport system ATPase subunit